jgi:hypothetical protein
MIGRGKRRTRLGFSIIEVLMALSLLVMFFAASGEVFKSTVLLSSASQDLCDHTSQIDSVERQLRVDAWNCRSMTLADPQSVELTMADGAQISWKIDPQNCVVRTDAAGHAERRDAVGVGWAFSTDKVSLSISDGSSVPTRIVSQVLLAQSGQP